MANSMRNEPETRAELIDPQLKAVGWDSEESSVIVRREYHITDGEIQNNGIRKKGKIADYVLEYRGVKLAVIEAKRESINANEGITQANDYAKKLGLNMAFATNGKEIYQINQKTGKPDKITSFPTPQELWEMIEPSNNPQFEKFNDIPFKSSNHKTRYYQEIAVNKAMQAIANGESRILLTLATGTGKTFIASQIAWKLFESRWALKGEYRPRILFLADRNILASQAFMGFKSAFGEDGLRRIDPENIAKKGDEPITNGSVFFTIFQAFMSGKERIGKPYYQTYPHDFFDFIIIDECHRGGANDEGTWRDILNYFESAVQLGLTATPRKEENRDTYDYFGKPVFTYSLKEGIEDGFLTPFQVRYFQSNIDNYAYDFDDDVEQGNIDEEKLYTERDFGRIIEIEAREKKRVKDLLDSINPNDKTLVFCANQAHAAKIRDLINQQAERGVDYCVRVTSKDGPIGDAHLFNFRDNEKTIPTILTTSQKLTTGVDALNVRNIVLLRPVNSMIEFKQIIGRGTRIYEGKHYFTIIDFVKAYKNFKDPDWDGLPVKLIDGDDESMTESHAEDYDFGQEFNPEAVMRDSIDKEPPPDMILVNLSDERTRQIKSIQGELFQVNGIQVPPEDFVKWLFEEFRLPELLGSEENLCETWGNPEKRKEILQELEERGCPRQEIERFKNLIQPQDNDLFDVINYVAYDTKPISRTQRVELKKSKIYEKLDDKQKIFADIVLGNYIKSGENEFEYGLIDILRAMDCYTTDEIEQKFGSLASVKQAFQTIQQQLYQ